MRVYLNKDEIQALSKWEDCPESLKEKLGLVEVYLIEIFNMSQGTRFWETYDCPQKTNISGEYRISGWLGETNNINRTALGKYPSLKEAIDYIETEENLKTEPLDIDEILDESMIWRGQILKED
ncbi:hypothetical protein LCGC14_2673460 [marine sediment metagenome]|uniref:Uncharacterized protein n=1 Tax=marine sediment metagenome TaxID=412755 RepID=A0A0F9BYF8_9ZZZZ